MTMVERRDMDLLCSETDGIPRAFEDKVMLEDERVISNLLMLEERFLPNGGYFSLQPEVKPYMRREVAQWMREVCKEQRCEREVFLLSMNYVDRFLSLVPIKKTQLQLLGTASLLIASKLKDNSPFVVEHLVRYTDYSVTIEELVEWELLVLKTLQWDISVATAYDFVEQILTRLTLPRDQQKKIQNCLDAYIDFSATELNSAVLPPSVVAAISILTAIHWLRLPQQQLVEASQLVEKLQKITAADLGCLRSCQEQLEQLLLTERLPVVLKHPEEEHHVTGCQWDVACLSTRSDQVMTPTDVLDIMLVQ